MDDHGPIAREPRAVPAFGGAMGGRAGAAGRWVLPLRVLALLTLGSAVGLAINVAHPRAVRLGSFAAPSSCVAPAAHAGADQQPAVEILSLAQVANLCGDPRALVADARNAERFAEGHVTGAIHLSCASTRGAASAALDQLSGKDTLVVYGDGTGDALPVAEEMRRRGDRPGLRVAVMAGGFSAWSQAGLACSSGPCADCAARP